MPFLLRIVSFLSTCRSCLHHLHLCLFLLGNPFGNLFRLRWQPFHQMLHRLQSHWATAQQDLLHHLWRFSFYRLRLGFPFFCMFENVRNTATCGRSRGELANCRAGSRLTGGLLCSNARGSCNAQGEQDRLQERSLIRKDNLGRMG